MRQLAVVLFLAFLIPPVLRINYPNGKEKLVAQKYRGSVWLELVQADGHMAGVALDKAEIEALRKMFEVPAVGGQINEVFRVPDLQDSCPAGSNGECK